MSRVFVVQQHMRKDRDSGGLKSHDYDTASMFGEVIFLVPMKEIVDRDWGGDVQRLLESKLESFTADDYLLPSGDAILCAQAVLAAANMLEANDKMRFLKWNRFDNIYQEVLITIPF